MNRLITWLFTGFSVEAYLKVRLKPGDLTFSGVGTGLIWVTYIVAVTVYFKKKLALAQGLAFAGAGVSYVVFPSMYQSLNHTYSWRGTFYIITRLWMHAFIAGGLLRPVSKQCQKGEKTYLY